MSNVVGLPNSRPFDGHVLHVVAHLSFAAGRYIVDTAIEQARLAPGSIGVVTSVDVEGAGASSPALLAELAAHQIPVFQCGDFFKRDPAGLRAATSQLREIITGSRADLVVHAHTAMAVAVARWAGAPTLIATFHGWNQNRPAHIELQDAMALSLADRVAAVSDFWAEVLHTKTSLSAVAILPYGLNLDRYPARRLARRDSRAPRVVVVGDITDRMAPDLVLNAMARVWTQLPTAELHFIGDGAARQKTEALARTLDPSGTRVVFHGALPNAYDRLDEFDVFARANRSDDQSIPVAEALLAGLPIVCTSIGSQAPWVRASRSGLVIAKDAPRRFAAALNVLLTTSVEAREELGAAGRAFARTTLGIRHHVSQLERLYAGQVLSELPHELPRPHGTLRGDGPIRLHLGCGPERREGWINVDARSVVNPDVVAVADSLPMFDDGSVETIEACHLLEHLPVHEARRAFEEWFRLLRAGGCLYLELPNLDACVRSLGKHKDDHGDDLGMIGLFGWPTGVERDGVAQVHKWGWTPDSLAAALEAAGFTGVARQPVTQTWRPATRIDRDFRVRAVKPVQ
jgi:glycosyltransferase involved in cell wall biosynthesis